MPKKVSKSKAAKVVKAVKEAFGYTSEEEAGYPGPKVNEYYSESGHPVVIWEEGPEQWPMLFAETEQAAEVREVGVYFEPVNHVVLGVYPA